ncbi:MAG: response regulator transcription factor [Saprospiraceae bacterium]|nr:response regulator transcription factor [Saprospiraceae bacterium]
MQADPIKLFAVDDSDQFLDSISNFFEPFPKQYELVGRFGDVREEEDIEDLLETIEATNPKLVLMDFSFDLVGRPDDFGIELTKRIMKKFPALRIVMLVGDDMDNDKAILNKVKRSFQAGAVAYLRKSEPHTWLECIRESVIHPDMAAELPPSVREMIVKNMREGNRFHLTTREIQAIYLLSEDKKVKEVAAHMEIGFDGANFHLDNAKVKLSVTTLQGLVAMALRSGIIV